MKDKPNILLIMTDQQSSTMMSCTGNKDLKTPAMDSMAKTGLRFDNAYCTQPLCIPQRCSMFAGKMPHELGITFNVHGKELENHLLMGRLFADNGYDTGYTGKWHQNIDQDNKKKHGFMWMENIRSNGADVGIPHSFQKFLEMPREKPFLFVASFNNPHNICEAARNAILPDGDPGQPASIDDMPELPANFNIPNNEPSVIRKVHEMYRDKNYPTRDWTDERWRKHRWIYCRITEILDNHIGKVLSLVRASKQAENTIVFFTSDHGDGNGHHLWNQKQVLYDEATRIPFIISGAGVNQPGRTDSRHLVSMGLDLIPTMCDYAGIKLPGDMNGLSLRLLADGRKVEQWRDHVVIETEFGTYGKPNGIMGRCVRTDQYKYMVYSEGAPQEQLIDMQNDPGEMKNLLDDPAHKEELTRHRKLLSDWIKETKDIFKIP